MNREDAKSGSQLPVASRQNALARRADNWLLATGYWAVLCVLCASVVNAASHRTTNFVVEAATPGLAQRVAEAAEVYRRELAIAWLEGELPDWSRPCPIRVVAGPQMAAGGRTGFQFGGGGVGDWDMLVQGTEERILDSVLPHEITHTIFASHFRRPLPRWADEGACSTIEHAAEQAKLQQALVQFLMTGRGLAFNQMFAMGDYPQDVLPLYAQGRSLALYLIGQGGRKKFVDFLADGLSDDWQTAVEAHYGVRSLGDLQEQWLAWVRQGSPVGSSQTPVASSQLQVGPLVEGEVVAFNAHRPGCGCAQCRAAVPRPDPEPPTAEESDKRPKPLPVVGPPPAPAVSPNYVTKDELSQSQVQQDAGIAKKIDELGKKIDALRSEAAKSDEELGGLVGKLTDKVSAADAGFSQTDQELSGRFVELDARIGKLPTEEAIHAMAAAAVKKGLAAAGRPASAGFVATWLGLPITGMLVTALGFGTPVGLAVLAGMWIFRRRVVKPIARKVTEDLDTRVRGGGDGGAAPENPFPHL